MEKKFKASFHDKKNIPHLMKELIEKMPIKQTPNYMFRNNGTISFEKVTDQVGAFSAIFF